VRVQIEHCAEADSVKSITMQKKKKKKNSLFFIPGVLAQI
jgi:hypothetical protein